jgi:hypothetical protein
MCFGCDKPGHLKEVFEGVPVEVTICLSVATYIDTAFHARLDDIWTSAAVVLCCIAVVRLASRPALREPPEVLDRQRDSHSPTGFHLDGSMIG